VCACVWGGWDCSVEVAAVCLRRNKWNIHTVYACPCAALCQLARTPHFAVPLEPLLLGAGEGLAAARLHCWGVKQFCVLGAWSPRVHSYRV